jgi:anti-anti-sigma factor
MNASFFRIRVAQDPQAWTIHLSGDVDYAASLELVPQLIDIADHCDKDLLIDLEGVTLIDSEGIKALLATCKRMRNKQGNARVVRCSPMAERVLRLVGVDEMLGLSAC